MKQRPLLTDQLYEIDWKKYENKKINPLAGIHITLQDLEKSGISYTSIYQMQQDKIAYLQDHSADAVSWVTNELTNMVEDVKEMPHETLKSLIFEKLFLLETIVTQLEKNSLQDTLVEQMRQVVDDIAMLIPREDKYGILRLPSQIDELINMRLDFNKRKMQSGYFAGFLKRITSARQYIEDEYTKEKLAEVYQRIYQLYNQDRSILKFLNDLKIDNTLLVNMIAMRPGEMELQYRHLREIKKEKFMLQEAEHTLKFMLTTDEVALRKSMSTFIHDIIQSMSFCNRVFGSGKSWISLKDKARICVNREKLQELFQEIRNTSIQTSCIQKYYQLLASPKYTDLKLFYISEESRSYRLLNRN